MTDDDDAIDPRLQAVLGLALAELLRASGLSGGIILAVTPDHRMICITAIDPAVPFSLVELLRLALRRAELGPDAVGGRVPMNG